MTRVLWLSRHKPVPAQKEELRRLFGSDVLVIFDKRPFASPEEVKQRMRRVQADEIMIIAPLTVLRILTEQGIKPLYAQMKVSLKEVPDVTVRRTRERIENVVRSYDFIKFRRLVGVTLHFEEL